MKQTDAWNKNENEVSAAVAVVDYFFPSLFEKHPL